MVSPAFPGLFFAFAAMVLLLFASISPPAWDKTYFLSADVNGATTLFGVFGECIVGQGCSSRSVGYDLVVGGANGLDISARVLQNLTYTLILHPIAGFIALLALVFGLIGAGAASRVATIFMAIFAFFGLVVALVAFVIDMVLWNVVKNKIEDAGYDATLGNANWFTVGAVGALILCTCTSICGSCGRFATGRMAGEKY
ncbi:actin cortical patch SUR7/pH-response regulator pali [Kockovaella imperatae]|uniref:Actin cortical patch SUR7/pH-response regulator pali n=1 Tax=Kockovaella imperatae TaxID=4999 RepID=A0A1Y1UPP0_9TREE|nr:actin cortical patch SUR7/pH-response regulator pali [Kockovaella imperatae]ORX39426.1 actin cortical patch SUR7/pH-response regulator pali [Kockovaella imperatae]